VKDSGYTQTPEQATLTGATPQVSARLAPPRGRGGKTKGNSSKQVYFSTEGGAFRSWYEELTGVTLDITAANARACNSLGQRASVTYENLKLVVNEVRTNKWVKRDHVAVTVQDLASEDKMLRWEKWLMAAQQSPPVAQSSQSGTKGYTLAVNDPDYNIDDDFYNNREAWAAFDAPPAGGILHV